jgi:hypothetical protein
MRLPHDSVAGTILTGLALTAVLFFVVRALAGAG